MRAATGAGGRWPATSARSSPTEQREGGPFGIEAYNAGHRRGIRRMLGEIGWEERYVAGQLAALEVLASNDMPGTSGRAFIASSEGDVLGFVSVEFRAWNRLGQLHGLAVDAALRRRGVASDLVRRAEGFDREQGGRGVYVDTPANNDAAQDFYRALGYEFA